MLYAAFSHFYAFVNTLLFRFTVPLPYYLKYSHSFFKNDFNSSSSSVFSSIYDPPSLRRINDSFSPDLSKGCDYSMLHASTVPFTYFSYSTSNATVIIYISGGFFCKIMNLWKTGRQKLLSDT